MFRRLLRLLCRWSLWKYIFYENKHKHSTCSIDIFIFENFYVICVNFEAVEAVYYIVQAAWFHINFEIYSNVMHAFGIRIHFLDSKRVFSISCHSSWLTSLHCDSWILSIAAIHQSNSYDWWRRNNSHSSSANFNWSIQILKKYLTTKRKTALNTSTINKLIIGFRICAKWRFLTSKLRNISRVEYQHVLFSYQLVKVVKKYLRQTLIFHWKIVFMM